MRRWIIFALLCFLFIVTSLIIWGIFGPEDRGYSDFCGEGNVVPDGFQQFFKNRKNYPTYSMEQLQEMGAIEDETMFDYWVHYTPFSSKTPDNQVVLRMGYSPFAFIPWFCDFSWTKYDLTHISKSEPNPWKDRLEIAKEKEVQAFEADHPSCRVVAALAWFNGTVPENSHAELIIDYRMQNDPQSKRAHFDFSEGKDIWILQIKAAK